MRICIAQIKPDIGNIQSNIETHKKWIETAAPLRADLIAFPELSLTGYEPRIAEKLATDQNDSRLDTFQDMSDLRQITIGIGLPVKSESGISIGMLIFQPNKTRKTYSKQILHSDEKPYFIQGDKQYILSIENLKIAPAICYEALQEKHNQNANRLGAEIYLACVAKPQNGIEKAYTHFSKVAIKYSITVLMANSIGVCDNFRSAGQSAVWSQDGTLKGKLKDNEEGILLFDTETGEVITRKKLPKRVDD